MSKKKVLIVDDEKLIRWTLSQKLQDWNLDYLEATSGGAAFQVAEEEGPDLVILDIKLPDVKGTDLLEEFKKRWPELPVIMITAFGVIDDAVIAMRRGAYDFITKPIDYAKLQSTVKNALETVSLKREIALYREKGRFDFNQIIATSRAMQQVLDIVKKIAESEASIVLLQGESGTGKDLLAQAIHHLSRRKNAPFLAINCSAIPENLLESELFGFEKGAFTDAKQQKKGLAEMADEGTLFLDEISTLSLHFQAKILRFLETHTIKRIGGLKEIEVDLRIIAATNHDIEAACQEGKFRRDLFYRLNVCPVYIPSLRERTEDVLPLARHFISHYNARFGKSIVGLQKEAENMFRVYNWPGNVRELKNAVERAMIFEENSLISTKHLPIHLNGNSLSPAKTSPGWPQDKSLSLPEMEQKLLVETLIKTGGNKTQAARLLKITRDTLRYRIRKYQIKTKDIQPSG